MTRRSVWFQDIFDILSALLILISVVELFLETGRGELSPTLVIIDKTIPYIFALEILIRISLFRGNYRRFFSHTLNTIDLVAVILIFTPFEYFRLLRLLRLIRLGQIIHHYMRQWERYTGRVVLEILSALLIFTLVLVAGAIAIQLSEGKFNTPIDAIWWSIFTLLAGEPIGMEPTTAVGKVITFIVIIGGFAMFAFITGTVSSLMIHNLYPPLEASDSDIEHLAEHILICGWNGKAQTFWEELRADKLTKRKPLVILADLQEVDALYRQDRHLYFINAKDISAKDLRKAGAEWASQIIIFADEKGMKREREIDFKSVLTAMTADKVYRISDRTGSIHNKYRLTVEVLNRSRQLEEMIELAGAEDIFDIHELLGIFMANSIRIQGFCQVMKDLLTSNYGSVFHVEKCPYSGITYTELLEKLLSEEQKLVIALRENNGDWKVSPPDDTILTESMDMLLTSPVDKKKHRRQRWIGEARETHEPTNLRRIHELQWDNRDTLRNTTMEDHIVICGWNRSGKYLIKELRSSSDTVYTPIVIIAHKTVEEIIINLQDEHTTFLAGDSATAEMLQKGNIDKAKAAIVLTDESVNGDTTELDSRSILTALTIEHLAEDIYTLVELLDGDHDRLTFLDDAHVEDIIMVNRFVGRLLAKNTKAPGMMKVVEELLTANHGCTVNKIFPPQNIHGKTGAEAAAWLKKHRNELLLAVESKNENIHRGRPYYLINPLPTRLITENDRLYVIVHGH